MPVTKQTIAIFGCSSTTGRLLARGLCDKNYRLLLFDEDRERADALASEIRSQAQHADVESLSCEHLASWEAEIIIIAGISESMDEFAEKTKVVSAQKIISVITDSENSDLPRQAAASFPHSEVVGVFQDKENSGQFEFKSDNSETLNTIRRLFISARLQVPETHPVN